MATTSSSYMEWNTLKVCSFVGASLGSYSGTDAFRSASKRATRQYLLYHKATATSPATLGVKQQNTKTNTAVIEEYKQATLQLWGVIGGLDGSIAAGNWKVPPPTTLLYSMASSKLNGVFMLAVDRMIIDDVSSVGSCSTTATSTSATSITTDRRVIRIPLIINARLVALMAHPGVPPAIQIWACSALAKLMVKSTALLVNDCSPSEVDATKEATRLLGYGIVNAANAWVSGGHAPASLGQLLVLLGATQISINAWPAGGGGGEIASSVLKGLALTVLSELNQIIRDHKCFNQVAGAFWRSLDAVSAVRWEAPYKAAVDAFVKDHDNEGGAPPHGGYDSEDGAAYVSALTTQVYEELYTAPLIRVLHDLLGDGSGGISGRGSERSLLKEMVESRWRGCLSATSSTTISNDEGTYRRSMIRDAPSAETPTPTLEQIRTAVSHLQFRSSLAPVVPAVPTDSSIVFTCWKNVLFDKITQKPTSTGRAAADSLIGAAITVMQHVPGDAGSTLDATILGLITAIKIESEKPPATGDDFDFSDDFAGCGDSGVSPEALIPHNPWYSDSASAILSDTESRRCNALSLAFKVGAAVHNLCCQLLDGVAAVAATSGGSGVGGAVMWGSNPPPPPQSTTSSREAIVEVAEVFGMLYPVAELRSLLDNATTIAPSQDGMSNLALGVCLLCQAYIEAPLEQQQLSSNLQRVAIAMQALMMGVCLLQQGNTKGGDVCTHGALLTIFGTHTLPLNGHTSSGSHLGDGIDGNCLLLVVTALTTLINRSNQFSTMDITHFYIPAFNTLCWALSRLSPSPTSFKSQVAAGAVHALLGDSPVGASLLHRWWSQRPVNDSSNHRGGSEEEWDVAKHLRRLLSDSQWNSYLIDLRARSPLSGWWLLSEMNEYQGRIAEAADTDDLFVTDTTPTRILQQQRGGSNNSIADQIDVSYGLSQLLELNRSPSISSLR